MFYRVGCFIPLLLGTDSISTKMTINSKTKKMTLEKLEKVREIRIYIKYNLNKRSKSHYIRLGPILYKNCIEIFGNVRIAIE